MLGPEVAGDGCRVLLTHCLYRGNTIQSEITECKRHSYTLASVYYKHWPCEICGSTAPTHRILGHVPPAPFPAWFCCLCLTLTTKCNFVMVHMVLWFITCPFFLCYSNLLYCCYQASHGSASQRHQPTWMGLVGEKMEPVFCSQFSSQQPYSYSCHERIFWER